MTIVLTNGYKGIVITDITAPLKGHQLISTFQEAVNGSYTFISPNPTFRSDYQLDFEKNNWTFDSHTAEELINSGKLALIPSLHPNSKHWSALYNILWREFAVNVNVNSLYYRIANLMTPWIERDLSILFNGTDYEFLKCNKTLLVDNNHDLLTRFMKLNEIIYSKKLESYLRIGMGTEGILKQNWGIYVTHWKWDNGLLAMRMSHLIGSGIPNQFKEMERIGLVKSLGLQDVKSRVPSPLNLNTNILTLFVIFTLGISVSICWLSIECFRENISSCKDILWRGCRLVREQFVNGFQIIKFTYRAFKVQALLMVAVINNLQAWVQIRTRRFE